MSFVYVYKKNEFPGLSSTEFVELRKAYTILNRLTQDHAAECECNLCNARRSTDKRRFGTAEVSDVR